MSLQPFTLTKLAEDMKRVQEMGAIKSHRPGNDGGVGNTLEDLLGIKENNIPLTDIGPVEIKSHREGSTSLLTLFHFDPLPRIGGRSFVQKLVENYGWPHKSLQNEKSFRLTLNGERFVDRGFNVVVDRDRRIVLIHFDHTRTDPRHSEWLESVEKRVSLGEMEPAPYWTFSGLENRASSKIGQKVLYVTAEATMRGEDEYLQYHRALLLEGFNLNSFIDLIQNGTIYIDFDARTGHNHGTKFRIRPDNLPVMYKTKRRLL